MELCAIEILFIIIVIVIVVAVAVAVVVVVVIIIIIILFVFHVTMHQPIVWLHLSLYKPHITHNSSIRSDEGLTLETSAFESLDAGQFTLSTQLRKRNYLVMLPTDAAPQFL